VRHIFYDCNQESGLERRQIAHAGPVTDPQILIDSWPALPMNHERKADCKCDQAISVVNLP